ncbi:hypothetical protein ElyMa_003539600 [Elysia marginata]|uniref:Uncharacterized protein n=1 Tax=Elysia marginata TaxID=1093978 RepID=A0AAV4EIH0_9GAST|nr:hypothetical protein ElyMa_003539600 [Elysia marginata]
MSFLSVITKWFQIVLLRSFTLNGRQTRIDVLSNKISSCLEVLMVIPELLLWPGNEGGGVGHVLHPVYQFRKGIHLCEKLSGDEDGLVACSVQFDGARL